MATVPRILFDQVDQQTPQARHPTVAPGVSTQLPQTAAGQRLRDQGAGALYGVPPQRQELRGGVLGDRAPVPVGGDFPVHHVPRRPQLSPVQPAGERVGLDVGQMLKQAAPGHRRGADGCPQACRVQSAARPPFRRLAATRDCVRDGRARPARLPQTRARNVRLGLEAYATRAVPRRRTTPRVAATQTAYTAPTRDMDGHYGGWASVGACMNVQGQGCCTCPRGDPHGGSGALVGHAVTRGRQARVG